MVTLILPLATGRYELALVTEKSEKSSAILLGSLITISSISTLFFTSILIFAYFLDFAILTKFSMLLAFPALLWGSIQSQLILHQLNRTAEFKIIAIMRLAATILKLSSQLWFGWIGGFGAWGLIIGLFVEYFIHVAFLVYRYKEHFWKCMFVFPDGGRALLVKYVQYPRFILSSSFLARASNELPILVITNVFGLDISGLFSLARRLLDLPSQLISESISKVFFKFAAERENSKTYSKSIINYLILAMLAASILVSPILYIYGKPIMSAVLNAEWLASYEFIIILFPLYGFRFAVVPFQKLLFLHGKQHQALKFQSILLATRLISFIAGYITGSIEIMLSYMVYGGLLSYSILWWIVAIEERKLIRETNESA
jgi:O-antigen/teichoic acid export membrane protein